MITNAVNVAADLSAGTTQVILTAGILHQNSFSLIGPFAQVGLRALGADVLFLDVYGFDLDFGLTAPSLEKAEVNRTMASRFPEES